MYILTGPLQLPPWIRNSFFRQGSATCLLCGALSERVPSSSSVLFIHLLSEYTYKFLVYEKLKSNPNIFVCEQTKRLNPPNTKYKHKLKNIYKIHILV